MYEDTINEVLDQYHLTPETRRAVFRQVMLCNCPWFRVYVYARTHYYAAVASHRDTLSTETARSGDVASA